MMQINERHHGFRVTRVREIREFGCNLIEMEHEKTGAELAQSSVLNPQVAYGADVITRIQQAVQGKLAFLTQLIRHAMTDLTQTVCDDAGISPL